MTQAKDTLPPLPKPDDMGDRWHSSHVYTADQMHAYAAVCILDAYARGAIAAQAPTALTDLECPPDPDTVDRELDRRLSPYDAVARAMDMASLLAGSVGANDRGKASDYSAKLRAHLVTYIYPATTPAPLPLPVQAEPAPKFDTSAAGRAQVAKFFSEHLGRHDFARYIAEALAADFACALAPTLYKLSAQPAPAAQEPPTQLTDDLVTCRYGDDGYACCEGRGCEADEHNDAVMRSRDRQPLTEQQLSEVMESVDFTYNPTLFARAVEAKHGITGAKPC